MCLLFCLLLVCCKQENEVHYVEISEYYAESCHLDQVTVDSIARFSLKVAGFVAAHPLAKNDPLYPRILTNIKNTCLGSNITIDTDWAGENHIEF